MDSMQHFFFSLRLISSLIWEWVWIAVTLSIGSISFITTTVFALLIMVGLLFSTPTPPPPVIQVLDRQTAETQIAIWEGIAAVTPTRDVFLNLEKLYGYIDEKELALTYRKRAFALDPNNALFQQDVLIETTDSTSEASF